MTLPLKILKTSFYSSDLTTYPQKIFQLFFYNKARRSVISNRLRSSPLPHRFFFNPFIPNPQSGFFVEKGEKDRRPFPLASKTKNEEASPDRRLIHTSTTPLLAALALNNAP